MPFYSLFFCYFYSAPSTAFREPRQAFADLRYSMKKPHIQLSAVLALCFSITANATSSVLAEKYLRETQIPAMLEAQVNGYTDQYTKGQDPAYRKQVYDYLQHVMGWNALKDEFLGLVRTTYTDQEINAFLKFANTPAGRSMKSKSTTFANKLAAISAKRVQEVDAERRASNSRESRDDQDVKDNELSITKVEKFQAGDQVYFTGMITNNSKKLARGLSIEANLFLGEKFVDQYSTYVSGAIPAGSSRLFKVSCGCKGSPPAEHDSFKLQVISGY